MDNSIFNILLYYVMPIFLISVLVMAFIVIIKLFIQIIRGK